MNIQGMKMAEMAFDQLSAKDRLKFISERSGQAVPQEPDRLLRPRDAAVRLGVTPRTVFNLLKSGALTRIRLPGRKRALGVRESEISALVAGGKNEP